MGITLTANGSDVSTAAPLPVTLPVDETKAGFAALLTENDDGASYPGTVRDLRAPTTSLARRLRAALDTTLFDETFPAGSTTLNTSKWLRTEATMTAAIVSGALILNNGNSVTSGQSVFVASQPCFTVTGGKGIKVDIVAAVPFNPVANNVVGFGVASTVGLVAALADGVCVRLSAAGVAELVILSAVAGVDGASTVISNWTTLVVPGVYYEFAFGIQDDTVTLSIGGKRVAQLARPTGVGYMSSSAGLRVFGLCQHTGTAASAQQLRIGAVVVTSSDENLSYTPAIRAALAGDNGYQAQTGAAIANTVKLVAANPTAAVPTNTTAALGSGLGGDFWETYSAALATEVIISSFQVPATSTSIRGKRLLVTGVHIDSIVQTVIAGGGLIEQWAIAFGHTNVSLATTEAAGAKAPRKLPIGARATAAAAAALVQFQSLDWRFPDGPIVVNPGEFIQTIKKNVGGTVGTSGTVHHSIAFIAVWI